MSRAVDSQKVESSKPLGHGLRKFLNVESFKPLGHGLRKFLAMGNQVSDRV